MASGAELERGLADMGVPDHARDWVRKALHPAGVAKPGVAIPDWSTASTARPEYVVEKVIAPPPDLSEGTWDCCIYTLPGDVSSVVIEAGPSLNADFASRTGAPSPVTGGYAGMIVNQPSVFLDSLTATLIGSNPVVTKDLRSYTSEFRPLAWRHTHKSLTVYMTASSLNDQGTVTSGIFPGLPDKANTAYSAFRGSGLTVPGVPHIFTLPLREEDMLVQNPRCRVSAAREGVYIPHTWSATNMPFVTPSGATFMVDQTDQYSGFALPVSGGQARGAYWAVRSSLTGQLQMAAYAATQFGVVVDPTLGVPVLMDSAFDGMSVSVTIFRGLSPQASLTVKSVVGFEVCVAPQSPIRQFVLPAGLPSDEALRAFAAIIAVSPQVYPSKANVFGAILPLLGKAAALAAPLLAPLAHKAVDWVATRLRGPQGVAPPPPPPAPVAPRMPVAAPARGRARASSVSSRASSRASAASRRRVTVRAPKRR